MRQKPIALIALAAMLILAGCSGGATTTTADTGGDQITKQEVLSAMESVKTYHVETNATMRTTANGMTQSRTILTDAAFDRTAQGFQVNQTVKSGGASQKVQMYFVDGTLYRHSAAYTSRYGSEWIKTNQTAGLWSRMDTLTRQRALLANATVTANGTATVDGIETRVLEADVDISAAKKAMESRLKQSGLGNAKLNVSDVTQRLWVNPETNRPIKTVTNMTYTVKAMGQSIEQTQHIKISFDYESPVSISLPAGAENAVSIGQ